MRQELFIKGEAVSYTLETRNVTAVLGKAYIYKVPTPQDVLRVVYRGLMSTRGLTLDEFIAGYNNGTVWMSKRKGQYTLWMLYGLLQGRIRKINRAYLRG